MIRRILVLSLLLLLFSCGLKSRVTSNDLKESQAELKLLSSISNLDLQDKAKKNTDDGEILALPTQEKEKQQSKILELKQETGLIDLRSNPKKPVVAIQPSISDNGQSNELDPDSELRQAIIDFREGLQQAENKTAGQPDSRQSVSVQQESEKSKRSSKQNNTDTFTEGRTVISEEPLTDQQIDEVTALALLGIEQPAKVKNSSNDSNETILKSNQRANDSIKTNIVSANNIHRIKRVTKTGENSAYQLKSTITPASSFKKCNLKRSKFPSYDALTRLIIQCQWRLSFVIKLNKFESSRSFSPQEPVILPVALFSKRSISEPTKVEEALDCQSSQGKFANFTQIKGLSSQCGWRNRDIMILNRLLPQNFINFQDTRLLLPPVLSVLRTKYQQELASPVYLPQKKQLPAWCNLKTIKADIRYATISKIADMCRLDARFLARLNQKGAKENVLNKTVILPRSINVKQKKRTYKYPISRNVCQDKVYKVEFAASISKLISVCDWGFRAFLKLNNRKASTLLLQGQSLILPASLYLKPSKFQPIQTSIDKLSPEQRYLRLCKRNLYTLSNTDNPIQLSKVCNWDFAFFAIINQIDTVKSPMKIPSQILLPNAVDQAREALDIEDEKITVKSDNVVSQDDNKRIHLCTQTEHARNSQVKNIIYLCDWNVALTYRLNNKVQPVTKNFQTTFYAPMSAFERFGGKTRKIWPIDNPNIIEPLANEKLRLKSAITQKVRSVQPGVVIYKHRNRGGLIDLAIMHEDDFISVYQNINKSSTKSGYKVAVSEIIGELKSDSDGLIFSLLKSGENEDALHYLSGKVN